TLRRNGDFGPFWREVLVPNLKMRFAADPVHSLEEIELLGRRWPENIHLHVAERKGRIVGGTVIYLTANVAHTQYISANEEGKEVGALDALFKHLIDEAYRDRRYFSFGTSNEEEGRAINAGLVEWKESFGARAWTNDTYTVPLASEYPLLSRY